MLSIDEETDGSEYWRFTAKFLCLCGNRLEFYNSGECDMGHFELDNMKVKCDKCDRKYISFEKDEELFVKFNKK